MKKKYFVHNSAVIDEKVKIGDNSKIWHFTHINKGAIIGKNCVIGQNVFISSKSVIGDNVKIQNNVSIYDSVIIEDDVFCGPSCVFTNVKFPRANVNRRNEFLETKIKKGVTIGANSTLICGIILYNYCMIGAGAVVTKNVKSHSLVVGNPARQIGWVGFSGERLDENLRCPRDGYQFKINKNGELKLVLKDK